MIVIYNSLVIFVVLLVIIIIIMYFEVKKGLKFDIGSFVGGIVLMLGVLFIFYIGCKMYYLRRGIWYWIIDEYDVII